MNQSLSFTHRYLPGGAPGAPLLLLHGTGGDENDLIPMGGALAPSRALLSPRGQVLENGMPRFFRRLAEGVFDEADVMKRAHDLANFVKAARAKYGLVGFSNGANIAAAMLLLRPEALAGAILIRAMVPLADPPNSDLGGKPVLILSGSADPIVPIENARRLADMLRNAKASVRHETSPASHGLTQGDLTVAAKWLQQDF